MSNVDDTSYGSWRWNGYLIRLDQHRRTVLDLLATLMILGGAAGIGLALAFLYPPDNKPWIPGSDVIAAASTLVAVGGILLGIGGNRNDHKKEADDRAKKKENKAKERADKKANEPPRKPGASQVDEPDDHHQAPPGS